jgi:hypothetical protein
MAALVVLAACTQSPHAGVRLTATLVSPTDITLRWKDEGDAAGHIVEFATSARGRYTILRYLDPRQTAYTHPDLIPETPFYYRVRPFYGPVSRAIDVVLPGKPGKRQADESWAYPRTVPGPAGVPVARHSVRDSGAAPTDLRGSVVNGDGIRFTWTDHSTDEEGFLLESKPSGAADFGVVAVMGRDINAFGFITLPNEKRAAYRVRAYYSGAPSNTAHLTTGRADQA